MRLGFFMMPVHPPARTFTETLAEDTEKSLLADRLGFEELWLGEHFSATSEPIPSPLMFMAGLVSQTKNLRFGTGVICIPNHDPIIVAAEVAQFDHMSRGRFELGIGPGGLLSDFELFGHNDVGVRNRKVVEAVKLMQMIWSQDPPYEFNGEFRKFRLKDTVNAELGIGYMPKPYQKGGPPITLSIASPNSSSARTAAQQNWGIISANIVPTYSVASHWAIYSKACAEMGKKPSGEKWRVSRNIVVAPSDAEAFDRVYGDAAFHLHSHRTRRGRDSVGAQAAARYVGRRSDRQRHHRGLHALWLAEKHARQVGRVPRGGRAVRHAVDDRPRLDRTQRRVGAAVDAAHGRRGHAEVQSAHSRASGGITATTLPASADRACCSPAAM